MRDQLARTLFLLMVTTCVAVHFAPQAHAAGPATAAEAAKVLDLTTFPRPKDAKDPSQKTLAGLTYASPGKVADLFEFQKKALAEKGFKEVAGSGYVSDQAASSTFKKDGFSVSVMVFPAGTADEISVTLLNHGNVDFGTLPLPSGTKALFAGPVSRMLVTEASVQDTADACHKLLTEKGWTPYGGAGDVRDYKQNGVKLSLRVSSAPAQQGKTVIDYSSALLSLDLPIPADAEKFQYSEQGVRLFLDTKLSEEEAVKFYRDALAKQGWEATTTNPIKTGFRKSLIFRNPAKEMLIMEISTVEGKQRITLRYYTAPEVEEMLKKEEEAAAKKKLEKEKLKKK